MNLNKLTDKAQEALVAAEEQAESRHNTLFEPEHLLLALIKQDGGGVVQQETGPAAVRWRGGRRAPAGTAWHPRLTCICGVEPLLAGLVADGQAFLVQPGADLAGDELIRHGVAFLRRST
jgi:hypothetical protein